jgi:hypothetical protein
LNLTGKNCSITPVLVAQADWQRWKVVVQATGARAE